MYIKSIFGGNPLSCSYTKNAEGISTFAKIFAIICIVFLLVIFYYVGMQMIESNSIRNANISIQTEEVKNTDCVTLGNIYLDVEDDYYGFIEEMAKKRFDIKC